MLRARFTGLCGERFRHLHTDVLSSMSPILKHLRVTYCVASRLVRGPHVRPLARRQKKHDIHEDPVETKSVTHKQSSPAQGGIVLSPLLLCFLVITSPCQVTASSSTRSLPCTQDRLKSRTQTARLPPVADAPAFGAIEAPGACHTPKTHCSQLKAGRTGTGDGCEVPAFHQFSAGTKTSAVSKPWGAQATTFRSREGLPFSAGSGSISCSNNATSTSQLAPSKLGQQRPAREPSTKQRSPAVLPVAISAC